MSKAATLSSSRWVVITGLGVIARPLKRDGTSRSG
jgi:hypothetical protein